MQTLRLRQASVTDAVSVKDYNEKYSSCRQDEQRKPV